MEKFEKVSRDIHRKEIVFDSSREVVMANRMILHSASNLSLNEMKLLRYIIMQTKKGDDSLFEYDFGVKDFADDLGISVQALYRDLNKMSDHIMGEVLSIGTYTGNHKKDRWRKFHWVDVFDYYDGRVAVKLSEELKPFLLHLAGEFTKYEMSEIIDMKSTYAIRIYETIRSYMNDHDLPFADHQNEISISMEVLRKITNTEQKFDRYSSFKAKVIDIAVNEINRCSKYHVVAEPYKKGRAVAGFDFLIESQAGYKHRELEERAKQTAQQLEEQIEGQMELSDFLPVDDMAIIQDKNRNKKELNRNKKGTKQNKT